MKRSFIRLLLSPVWRKHDLPHSYLLWNRHLLASNEGNRGDVIASPERGFAGIPTRALPIGRYSGKKIFPRLACVPYLPGYIEGERMKPMLEKEQKSMNRK